MLTNVHVKNLALIDKADIFFSEGLNILSGETGAGKSILLGAIHLALGGKYSKEMIRSGANDALAELTFVIDNPSQKEELSKLDIDTEAEVVLTRKIIDGRSISRINGEAASVDKLRHVADILMDIHTQRETASILTAKKQLDILDSFIGEPAFSLKAKVYDAYYTYNASLKDLEEFSIDEAARAREVSLLEYEINEIFNADPAEGEDEELEALYKRLVNSKKITAELSAAYSLSGYDEGAGTLLGRACMSLSSLESYDEDLKRLSEQLAEIDNLLNDFNRDIADCINDFEFDEEKFTITEERLNILNHIKMKYGKTITDVLKYRAEKEERLSELMDYENNLNNKKAEVEANRFKYEKLCAELTALRSEYAVVLKKKILEELSELNFLKVDFEIEVEEAAYTLYGADKLVFKVSFNPGEELKSMEKIASGGELSRFMLAVKTVLADNDLSKALLFDEIDSGISGITAQKVADKLAKISKKHQVICITHLPQIASMADRHFKIEKKAVNDETLTEIETLDRDGEIAELARMISGDQITEVVLQNASDLKAAAGIKKESYSI